MGGEREKGGSEAWRPNRRSVKVGGERGKEGEPRVLVLHGSVILG